MANSFSAGHVVLLGDSIFDNGAYVGGAPDVVRQLRGELGGGCHATLLAVDGAVVDSVHRQLEDIPDDATLLVVSAGGNDALGDSHLLEQSAQSVAEGLGRLAEARAAFAGSYERMVEALLATGRPIAVCTIYDANFPGEEGRLVRAGLALFNDVITRAAFSRALPLIDLRLLVDDPADYANRIEPSERGGLKIARAIAALARGGEQRARSVVIAE